MKVIVGKNNPIRIKVKKENKPINNIKIKSSKVLILDIYDGGTY